MHMQNYYMDADEEKKNRLVSMSEYISCGSK